MERERFDALVRHAVGRSRRGTFRLGVGAIVASVLACRGFRAVDVTEAKKRGKKKGKKGSGRKGTKKKSCDGDGACSQGQVCHPKEPLSSIGTCGPRCSIKSDCGRGNVECDLTGHCRILVECFHEEDCPQGGIQYACDDNRCVFVCLFDTDCQPGESCIANRCTPD